MLNKQTCYNCQKRIHDAEYDSRKQDFMECLDIFDEERTKMDPSMTNIDQLENTIGQAKKAVSLLWNKQFEREQFDGSFHRQWSRNLTCCPVYYSGRRPLNVNSNCPKNCSYALEHVVLNKFSGD